MGVGDYRSDDQIGPGLSTGLGRAPDPQAYERAAQQQEQTQNWAAGLGILLGVVLLVVAVIRRKTTPQKPPTT